MSVRYSCSRSSLEDLASFQLGTEIVIIYVTMKVCSVVVCSKSNIKEIQVGEQSQNTRSRTKA